MDFQTESLLRGELDSNERLLWSGRPKQGIVFRGSDAFMIPFSLLWGGFAIFWEFMALSIPSKDTGPVGLIFPIFGIPFVLAGLYMIFGRFIVDAKKRAKTYYGLSDQRVIILSGLFGKKIKSLNIRTLTDISLTEKADGKGTILFGQDNPWSSWFGGGWFPGMSGAQTPRFEMIADAKIIYNKIRNAQQVS